MLSLEDRVQNGIFLLDMTVVGWDEKVDLDILNLSSCTRCVLGQLIGWCSDEFYRLFGRLMIDDKGLATIRCGFMRNSHYFPDGYNHYETGTMHFYHDLTNIWKKAILERRAIRAIIADMEEFAKN